MPDRYVNNIIEPDRFLAMNAMGDLYTGFVQDTGYAYVVDIPPLQTSGNDEFHIPFRAQAIDRSKEARVRSLNLTDEELKRKIIQCNVNGTYSISIAGSKVLIDNLDDIQVHIHDDGTNLLVDLNIKKTSITPEQTTIKNFSTTIKLSEAPIYFATNIEGYSAGDYIEGVDRALSTVGVPIGFLSETWGIENTRWASKKRAQKYANNLHKSLKNNGIKIQTRELKDGMIPKSLKVARNGLAFAGKGLVVADIYCSKQIKASHIVSIYMLSAAFPVSWVLGGVILSADILLECYTDKGLGDWIDYYAGKIGIGDDNGVLFGGERRYIPNTKNKGDLIFEPDRLRVVRPQIFDKYEIR